MNFRFLDLDDVLAIHEEEIGRFGGLVGLRDRGLLDSAIAQPRATFEGQLLHEDLFSMSSAYLFHMVKNHPFLDGNKRTGLISALTFLAINGVAILRADEVLYEATIGVAEGRLGKEGLAEILRCLAATSA